MSMVPTGASAAVATTVPTAALRYTASAGQGLAALKSALSNTPACRAEVETIEASQPAKAHRWIAGRVRAVDATLAVRGFTRIPVTRSTGDQKPWLPHSVAKKPRTRTAYRSVQLVSGIVFTARIGSIGPTLSFLCRARMRGVANRDTYCGRLFYA